jgi:choline dehydrogenase-like flavoprotein
MTTGGMLSTKRLFLLAIDMMLSLPGWSGDEFFEYMKKSETFHNKPWFEAEGKAHGYDGPIHTEPHDLAPISKLLLKSMESQGLPAVPDMFSTGETAHGCGHAPRTRKCHPETLELESLLISIFTKDHKGIRTTAADFVTNTNHRNNIEIVVETNVDKVNFENANGKLHAHSVTLLAKDGSRREVRARKEIIISGGTVNAQTTARIKILIPFHRYLLLSCNLDEIGYRRQRRTRETWHQMQCRPSRCR